MKSINMIMAHFRHKRRLNRLTTKGLPSVTVPAISYLMGDETVEPEIAWLIEKIEDVRNEIATRGDTPIEILYSPKPGSSGTDVTSDLRPVAGKPLQFTMRQVAQTGKDQRWGTVLHLLARAAHSEIIVELGSCVGISGCYLASSPYCRTFITVEGSPSLAKIAENSLRQIVHTGEVYNKLFDDALDEILSRFDRIDFAFIDGHHEKVATIHYFERLKPQLSPGALVVFDDISWSRDMRECWEYLARQQGFTDALDCGVMGVCIWDPDKFVSTKYWDMQEILGKQPIGDPHGWKVA